MGTAYFREGAALGHELSFINLSVLLDQTGRMVEARFVHNNLYTVQFRLHYSVHCPSSISVFCWTRLDAWSMPGSYTITCTLDSTDYTVQCTLSIINLSVQLNARFVLNNLYRSDCTVYCTLSHIKQGSYTFHCTLSCINSSVYCRTRLDVW